MDSKKLIKINFILNLFFLSLIVIGGFVWADTNGVWQNAEDVVAGIFGADEGGGDFIFMDNVEIQDNLTVEKNVIIEDRICIEDECFDSWDTICQSWLESNSIN